MDRRFRVAPIIAVMLVVGLLSAAGLQAAKTAPRMIPDNFSALAEQVGPAVVNIQVEKTGRAEEQMRPSEGHPFGMNPFGDERFKDFFGKQMPPQERRQAGIGGTSRVYRSLSGKSRHLAPKRRPCYRRSP